MVDGCLDEVRRAGEDLRDGKIGVADWQRVMESAIKRSHSAVGMVAGGGKDNARQSDYGFIGSRVREQYGYLRDFAREVADGLALDGQFFRRMQGYVISATGTYEELTRKHTTSAGFREEHRRRHSQESCVECVEYEARGWVAINTLPAIGTQSRCLTFCRCTFEFRKGPGGAKLAGNVTTDDRCRRRSRAAALRHGINAAPFRLYASADALPDPNPAGPVETYGEVLTVSESLDVINGRRGAGPSREYTPGDLYLHPMEAGNDNYIGDRSWFLGKRTLMNVAKVANARGFALMNSHRTGGLSSESELPYGSVYAGMYQKFTDGTGKTRERVIVQAYMLRGHYPNGRAGMTTDDIHRGIDSATITDVSLGLSGGQFTCDVCGNGYRSRDDEGNMLCRHVAGTSYRMTAEERDKQRARGVDGGVASITLDGAYPREVSAVYKGAVPGAGFRSALLAARSGELGPAEIEEAMRSYAGIALAADWRPARLRPENSHMPRNLRNTLSRFLSRYERAMSPEEQDEVLQEATADLAGSGVETPADDRLAKLQADLDETRAKLAETERRDKERQDEESRRRDAERKAALARIDRESDEFAALACKSGKVIPADRTKSVRDFYHRLATIDLSHPDDPSLSAEFRTIIDAVPPREFLSGTRFVEGVRELKLSHDPADTDDNGSYDYGRKLAGKSK